jgi:glycosyltransferase involved in cell wall biosynthesis
VPYTICHLTTVHQADDVRIFYKECLSLSRMENYKVMICAAGNIPSYENIVHYKIAKARSFRPLRFIVSNMVVLKLLTKVKADIWHIHDPELLPVAALLIFFNHKVIWDSHEDYFFQFKSNKNYRNYIPKILYPIVKQIFFLFLNYIDKNAAGIIGATNIIAKRYSNRNVEIVGNEAVLSEFSLCTPKFKNKTVIYIGQPSSNQCYEEVVKAVSKVPDLRLTVACREFRESDMRFSLEFLSQRFEYLGWLDRSKLSKAISNSTIGLVTYSNNLNHQDNQPNKFYEFCASGLPIVATPTKSNSDLINDSKAGILAQGFDSEAIAQALFEITSSEQNWLNYSQLGKNWVTKNGNWIKSEIALHRVYSNALSNRKY